MNRNRIAFIAFGIVLGCLVLGLRRLREVPPGPSTALPTSGRAAPVSAEPSALAAGPREVERRIAPLEGASEPGPFQPAPDTVTIYGRVVNDVGEAVEGVRVWLYPALPADLAGPRRNSLDERRRSLESPSTKSGPNGQFAFQEISAFWYLSLIHI